MLLGVLKRNKEGQDQPLFLPKLKSFWKYLMAPCTSTPMALQVEALFTNGCFTTTGDMQKMSHAELLDPRVPKKPYFAWQLLRASMERGWEWQPRHLERIMEPLGFLREQRLSGGDIKIPKQMKSPGAKQTLKLWKSSAASSQFGQMLKTQRQQMLVRTWILCGEDQTPALSCYDSFCHSDLPLPLPLPSTSLSLLSISLPQ